MLLFIGEILFILILIIILFVLVKEESKIKKSRIPRARIKEYWDGQERRQATRVGTNFTVKYTLSKKQNVILKAQTKDLSSSGMRLLINEKLDKGTLLSLEFDIPDTPVVVKAEGRVVWESGDFADRDEEGKRVFQAGVQFTQMSENDRNCLSDYVTKIKV